ncbi:hypothetical protein LNP04_16050 [Chryseobacterium sp. C-71]|uniref:hypothetical protein n=1 Tax=Chryseobacterium sp. C-71 TaxID=2893882 RepID=UPI001E2FDFC9|nr:hypothetical protein [Chryseobacterium sp. C-71]UFH31467.1 hypothetical protein LNP04_16050 [Chryseobacterium sp. C-71]
MKEFFAILILTLCFSCISPESKNQPQEKTVTKTVPQIEAKKDSIKIDTIEFVSYNDNFDYTQLNGKKENEEIDFVNDNNNDRSFLRGDLIAIKWKNDTIYIAGDGETPQIAQWIVSAKKIKDGNVSKLRKQYGKPIKYHYSKEDEISDSYLEHLHDLAEYYIANSKNDLVKLSLKDKIDLAYSVEKQTRDNKEYYVLGIYTESENKISTIQWLYIAPETDKIYEYDLPEDKLIYFP